MGSVGGCCLFLGIVVSFYIQKFKWFAYAFNRFFLLFVVRKHNGLECVNMFRQ